LIEKVIKIPDSKVYVLGPTNLRAKETVKDWPI
jgi:hypothetical protein